MVTLKLNNNSLTINIWGMEVNTISKIENQLLNCGFISIFFFLFILPLSAQEKLGIANSNYSSTNSIYLNPSSSTDCRSFIQSNLIGANAYFMTNQAYIPDFSVWQAAKGNIQEPRISTLKTKKFLYSIFSVDGLAAVLSNKEIGIGFFTRGRAVLDIRNIPYELTNIILEVDTNAAKQKIDINIRNAKFSEMVWVEYGINFSKMIRKDNDVLITAGANVKYITGINIMYANLQRFRAQIQDTTIDIQKLKGKFRMNEPGWNTGKGLGIDVGITYKKTLDWIDSYYVNSPKSGCKYVDYKYKLGLSLLDLGTIRFANNTAKGEINGSAFIGNYQQDSVIQNNFKGSFRQNDQIWATLPTALSAQFDWNSGHHFYINTTVINSVTTSRMTGVQRGNLLSITPRYERKNFEVAFPLTFQRYIYPQLGFAFRIRSFVLGLDNVFPLIIKKKTYGLNLYFNIGFSMFKNPACRKKHAKLLKVIMPQAFTNYKAPKKKKGEIVDDCPTFAEPNTEDQQEKLKKEAEAEEKQKKEEKKKNKKPFFKRIKSTKE